MTVPENETKKKEDAEGEEGQEEKEFHGHNTKRQKIIWYT